MSELKLENVLPMSMQELYSPPDWDSSTYTTRTDTPQTVQQATVTLQKHLDSLKLEDMYSDILGTFDVSSYSTSFLDLSFVVQPAFSANKIETTIIIEKEIKETKIDLLNVCSEILHESIKKELEQTMEVPEPKQLPLPLNLKGTVSGRVSSKRPNMSNPPRAGDWSGASAGSEPLLRNNYYRDPMMDSIMKAYTGIELTVSDIMPTGQLIKNGNNVMMSHGDYEVLQKQIADCNDKWRK